MHDPDTPVFQHIQSVMASGDATGLNRPVGRVTVVKRSIRAHNSTTTLGPWRSLLFPWPQTEYATLPVVKSINIDRSLDQDAATCTIVFYNDFMQPGAFAPEGVDTGIGRPGFYTFDRGETSSVPEPSVYAAMGPEEKFITNWDYPYPGGSKNGNFYNLLIPNRILFTYQGYGSDNFDENGHERSDQDPSYIPAWEDGKLVRTGTWMIDSVSYSTDGMINVQCRDVGKVLLEQYIYPPMVPLERFPIKYCPIEITSRKLEGSETEEVQPKLHSSGNDAWLPFNGSISGNRPSHAFDGKESTFWLSIGNSGPRHPWSFEWIQADTQDVEINKINIHPRYAGMTCYISVHEGGSWQGDSTVPYDATSRPAAPNGSDIRYVKKVTNLAAKEQVITLPRTYTAKYVRLCFTNLTNSGIGTYPYRAGLRIFQISSTTLTTEIETETNEGEPGVIDDWSEAVKELCGWGGLTWYDAIEPADLLLGYTPTGEPLRVWGDFEWLGAPPIACTPDNYFVNKSFREAINQIKDFLGCVFFIEEHGGAIFRLPNVFGGGNFVTDPFAPDLSTMYSVLYQLGIYNDPHSDGLFRRGQMCTVLVGMLQHAGFTLPAANAGPYFDDVAGTTHEANINLLAEAGIAQGVGGGLFEPNTDITREQTASLAVLAAEWALSTTITPSTNPYSDVPSGTHQTNVLKAHAAGIMLGYPDGTFRPTQDLTRNQSATVMYRMGQYIGAVLSEVVSTTREGANEQISTSTSAYLERRWPIELHENSNLISYSVSIDDSQLRSEILVVGESPDVSSDMVMGGVDLTNPSNPLNFKEVLAGQTRLFQVPGDQSRGFQTNIECQRMAELTALFLLFTYRKSSSTAMAHPGLMLDDQIRIYERVTNEMNIHYVSAISTMFDAGTGEYTMDLTTHWLGRDPDTDWFLDNLKLTDAVRRLPAVLRRLGEG